MLKTKSPYQPSMFIIRKYIDKYLDLLTDVCHTEILAAINFANFLQYYDKIVKNNTQFNSKFFIYGLIRKIKYRKKKSEWFLNDFYFVLCQLSYLKTENSNRTRLTKWQPLQ